MPVFSSHGFTRGNARATSRVWKTKQFGRFTALPNQGTADKGVVYVDLHAEVPSQQAGTPFLPQIGLCVTGAATPAFGYANENLEHAYHNYDSAVLLETRIKVYAIPVGQNRADGTQGVDNTDIYTSEAQVSLTLSKATGFWGATSDACSQACINGDVTRAYNTAVGFTRQNQGVRAVGCTLEQVYRPKELFQVRDILDNLADHSFLTNGDVLLPQDYPAKPAYFNLLIGPPRSGTPDGTGASVVHGRVLPHRVSIQFEHTVLFYNENPTSGTINIPTQPPGMGSMFAEAASAAGAAVVEAMEGAGADSFDRPNKRSRGRDMLDL